MNINNEVAEIGEQVAAENLLCDGEAYNAREVLRECASDCGTFERADYAESIRRAYDGGDSMLDYGSQD